MHEEYLKGRGAQINTANRFLKNERVTEHIEGLDEPMLSDEKTTFFMEYPKTVVNRVDSPDLGLYYSVNPYQGCEHGCIYCYARNAHQYWGFSAGLDFERKIIVKPEAPQRLREFLSRKNYIPEPISFSGNTDCYQPAERKYRITRGMLEICLEHRHPVSIISKNALIVRDLDILREMAKYKLVHVTLTITSLDEHLRLLLEPRTTTYRKRLETLKILHENGVSVSIMMAPIIPGLTVDEIPSVIKAAGEAGAYTAGMTILRLNGSVKELFHDWVYKNLPDRADKIWNQVCEVHGGQVNDTRWGTRMKGEGKLAASIGDLFRLSVKKFMSGIQPYELDFSNFKRPSKDGQMSLFP